MDNVMIKVYLRLGAGSHGVPSLKSQHEGKVPTFEPQESKKNLIYILQSQILIVLCKNIHKTCVEIGSSFLPNPTLNTRPKPHLQKTLPCRLPCHTRGLRTWVLV